jgi:beta-glucosidase
VVQLYGSDPVSEVTRPVVQLLGYARVTLRAGAAARVAFSLHTDRFSYVGLDRRRIVDPGTIELTAGASLGARSAPTVITLTGPRREVQDPVLTTPARIEELAD